MPRWLVWCVLALLFFGGWAVAPKTLPREVPGVESQALSTIGVLPILAVLCFSKNLRSGNARLRGAAIAFVAGLLMVAGNIFYYEALSHEKAMTVTPLTALYPLVTVALALVFLREKPHALQVCGIGVALAAMFIFGLDLNKGDSLQGMADWRSIAEYVLLPICLWGVAGLLQKLSTNYASSDLSTFWFQAAPLPAAVILFARGYVGLSHSPREWLGFLLIGLLLGLGNLALIASFGSGGKASIVTPLSGLYSVVAIPLAMLFGERAGKREVGVIALALIAVVLLSWERRKETGNVGQTS